MLRVGSRLLTLIGIAFGPTPMPCIFRRLLPALRIVIRDSPSLGVPSTLLPTLGFALPATCLVPALAAVPGLWPVLRISVGTFGHFLPQKLWELIIIVRCLRFPFCAVIPKDYGT